MVDASPGLGKGKSFGKIGFPIPGSKPKRMAQVRKRKGKRSTEAYLAFARWRVQLYRSQKPRESVRFFRRSRNHSLLWNFVMYGYYSGSPPTVGECEKATAWSRPTVRKLMADAESKGLIEIRQSPDDQRKRLVFPTSKTIAEYEAMVGGYLNLWERLRDGTAGA